MRAVGKADILKSNVTNWQHTRWIKCNDNIVVNCDYCNRLGYYLFYYYYYLFASQTKSECRITLYDKHFPINIK